MSFKIYKNILERCTKRKHNFVLKFIFKIVEFKYIKQNNKQIPYNSKGYYNLDMHSTRACISNYHGRIS